MALSEPEPEPTPEPEAEPEITEDIFTEPEAESGSTTQLCLFVTLYSICIVFILVGNITVAVTIMKDKTLRRNTSNLYLFSLVTARTCIGVFVVPGRITGLFSEEYLGSVFCKLCHYFAMGSAAASVFSIMAIAMVKYLAIVRGLGKVELGNKQSLILMGLIWLLGFLYAIRAPVVNDLVTIDIRGLSSWGCTISEKYREVDRAFIIVDMICLFVIPFAVVIFCYSQVIAKLASLNDPSTMKAETKDVPPKVDLQSLKAIKMLIILIILFTICTMAPLTLKMYVFWGGGFFPGYDIVEPSVYLFSYSNAWFNVLVFIIFRDDLRKAFLSTTCSRRKPWGNKVNISNTNMSEIISSEGDSKKDKQNHQTLLIMDF